MPTRRFAIAVLICLPLLPAASEPAEAARGLPDFAAIAPLVAPLTPPDLSVPAVAPRLPLAAATSAAAPADPCVSAEAGDTLAEPSGLAWPADCAGALDANDTVDVYGVDVDAGARLSASVHPPADADFDLCLATPARVVVRCAINGTGLADHASLVTNETGTWLVAVVLYSGAGAYRLVVDAPPAPARADDCGAADAANGPEGAALLGWPAACGGSTRFLDDVQDWFLVDPAPGAAVRADVSATQPTLVCLFLPHDSVHPASCGVAGPDGPAAVYAGTPGAGPYRVLVFSPSDAAYALRLEAAAPQDDCASGADAPGNLFLGVPVGGPRACAGWLDRADAADVYRVDVPAGLALAVAAAFDPGVSSMLCVAPLPSAPFSPESCEIAWAGGSGVALAAAPAGEPRAVLVYVVAVNATAYTLGMDLHAPTAQDDCGSAADAADAPPGGVLAALPIECRGAILAADGDVWDLYRVTLTEGPVYAELTPDGGADFDLCLVDVSFTNGACSTNGGSYPEDLEIGWPAGPAYLLVARYAGTGGYHLAARQQDDCGTGADAGEAVPAALATPILRCDAVLDPWPGDWVDAYSIPAPALPDVVVIRVEPLHPRLRLCVVDDVQGRCTSATFSRLVVARDPLRPVLATVEVFGLNELSYTLMVDDPVANPPPIPPLA